MQKIPILLKDFYGIVIWGPDLLGIYSFVRVVENDNC